MASDVVNINVCSGWMRKNHAIWHYSYNLPLVTFSSNCSQCEPYKKRDYVFFIISINSNLLQK